MAQADGWVSGTVVELGWREGIDELEVADDEVDGLSVENDDELKVAELEVARELDEEELAEELTRADVEETVEDDEELLGPLPQIPNVDWHPTNVNKDDSLKAAQSTYRYHNRHPWSRSSPSRSVRW
jgi:hypothetical protein